MKWQYCVKEITIKNATISYYDFHDSINLDLNLNRFSIRAKEMDLENFDFEITEISLENAACRIIYYATIMQNEMDTARQEAGSIPLNIN